MTYRDAWEEGKGALLAAGIAEAELDARLLLEAVCGTDRNELLVRGDRELTAEEEAGYRELTAGRTRRIPLQYLTGEQDFMGLTFRVDERVLIPRQDTEILVEEALKFLHDGMRVLDVCTGSGCILISLLRYTNDCTGVGVDVSESALRVAGLNAERLLGEGALRGKTAPAEGAQEAAGEGRRICFVQGNLFEAVEGKFDVIVSNPPYVPSDVIGTLMPEVRDHEPREALDGREDGLFFYREIVKESRAHLMGGGMLFFEIGCDQGQAVSGLLEEAGFLGVQVKKDYGGLDRVVYGTLGFPAPAREDRPG